MSQLTTRVPNVRKPVIDTSRSPHAKLSLVSPVSVRLADGFWEPRMAVNRNKTLMSQYRQCESTGRIDNFRRASGKRRDLPFQGIYYNDSDVYKWLEGAVWSLGTHPDPELQRVVDAVIDEIAAAQQPDGYLNTYFMYDLAGERWSNIKDKHEMYIAGHFIQAAVAHKRALGSDALMKVAIRLADHILDTFGPDKRAGACGHQEIEMAMVELYRETGDERYLRQAEFFLDVRGRKPPVLGGGEYIQDHVPVKDAQENAGHAVRQLYMNSGATDVVLETGDPALRAAEERLWSDFTGRKMYITGGAGARYEGEAFGEPFELPNGRAYAETCAAIAAVMWGARMLALTADARYADLMERSLYNGVLSGLGLDGETYYYENPLADRGTKRRQKWFGCACCPPNLARTLAELPGYFLGASNDGLYVNLYAGGQAEVELAGVTTGLRFETDYPWNGRVKLTVEPLRPASFTLSLRIPGWTESAHITVNGKPAGVDARPGTYAAIAREWQAGDTVVLDLPMTPRLWEAHPHVESDTARIAVTRGPLVYCIEQADNPGIDPWDVVLSPDSVWTEDRKPELLNGIVTLSADAKVLDISGAQSLYRPAGADLPSKPARVTFIPYCVWGNREAGPMTVWVRKG